MSVATTSIVSTNAKIDWTVPTANGEAITEYEISILKATGTFATTSACDGTDPGIVAATECLVPLTTLRASPFLLTLGTLVQVKIRAKNPQGFGTES